MPQKYVSHVPSPKPMIISAKIIAFSFVRVNEIFMDQPANTIINH